MKKSYLPFIKRFRMYHLPFSLELRLRTQYLSLGEMTGPVSDEILRQEVHPGKWSALDNIAHLAVFQPIFQRRLQRVADEETPLFEPYAWQEDETFAAYRNLTNRELLAQYRHDREAFIRYVDGLHESDFKRKGRHPVYGSLNVIQLIEMFVLHESHHLFTIFKLLNFGK